MSSPDNPWVAKALLFDFDGTILDTESTVLTAWREEYAHHGLRLDEEAWLSALGADQDRYAALASKVGEGYDLDASQARKRCREAELVSGLVLRDGIEDCLREAGHMGWSLGLVSSSPLSWVHPHLDRLSLLDCFDVVVTREDAQRSKPFPDLYLTALSRLGITARDAIAVEDSANGVAAARAAGIRCVAFPNAVTARQDLADADLLAQSALWEQVRTLTES